MPGTSAREMLSRIPIKMANGGTVNLAQESALDQSAAYKRALESGGLEGVQAYYANLRGLADKYMAGEDQFAGNQPVGAEAYNIMLEAGISNTDLINAGVGQNVLNKIFTTPATGPRLDLPTTVESAYTANPVLAAEVAARSATGVDGVASLQKQGREFVANIQQDGITPAEKRLLRELALEGGYTLADIQAAGVDPSILFNLPVKEKAPPPPPETPLVDTTPFVQTQAPYTAPTVYQPLPEQPDIYAAGEPALDVAFRESAPRTAIPGMPGFYEYTPAASLRPATGAGMSFRPPSVTSRPRSLLSPTALSFGSASQDYATGIQQQDAALARAFANAGIQNASDYYTWRNRLRSGEFGIGGTFDPAAFESSFSSWASSQPAAGTSPTAQGTPLQGGYSDIAENADRFGADYGGGYANFNAAAGSTGPVSGYTIRPVDLRLPPPMYAEGGEVTQSRMMLEQLDADAMAQEPERQESEGLLRNITRGAMDIPSSVGGYLKSRSPIGSDLSFGESASMVFDDLSKIGGAIKEAAGEDPLGFAAEMMPVYGEYSSYQQAQELSEQADQAEAAGDTESAKMLRQLSTVSMAGAIPLLGMFARGGKKAVMAGARGSMPRAGEAFNIGTMRYEEGVPVEEIRRIEAEFNQSHQSDATSSQKLFEMATRADPAFQTEMKEISDAVGGRYVAGPVKTVESIDAKLSRKGGTAVDIPDPIRSTIVVTTKAQSDEIARLITDKMPTIDGGWQRVSGSGYFDRKLNVQYTSPDGENLTAEIQLTTPEMLEAKDTFGHKLYEQERGFFERYKSETDMPSSELEKLRQVRAEQERLYNDAAKNIDPEITNSLVEKFAKGGYVAGKEGKS